MDTGAIVAHSATDLRYRFISGRVALAPLQVLRCHEIDAHGWKVRFVILGASHAVVLERPDCTLTELLTCLPPVLSGDRDDDFECEVCAHGATHDLPSGLGVDGSSVALDTFPLQLGDAFKGEFEFDCQLDLDFPPAGDKVLNAALPRTRIAWRVTTTGLSIETIHTYPEDALGVRSRTTLALSKNPRAEN